MDFNLPTKIISGVNSLNRITEFSNKNILICSDKFILKNETFNEILIDLKNKSNNITLYNDILPDAPISKIKNIVNNIENNDVDTIVVIGGGSAMDTTKSARFFYEKIFDKKIPLIAVPTTSGTGSEVTNYVVIKDDETHIKTPIVDDKIYPDFAILDPIYVKSLPFKVARDSGIDVLTHVIESYVAKNSNFITQPIALEVIENIFKYLEKAVNGKDWESQQKIHYSATMAGIAFSQSGLGINHSIAHAIGGKFNIPHGLANGIILPYVIEMNASKDISLYIDILDRLNISGFTNEIKLNNFLKKIFQLRESLSINNSLMDLGISEKEIKYNLDEIISLSLNDPCTASNPVSLTEKDIKNIVLKAFKGDK